MAYVLADITPDDEKKIFADADDEKRRILKHYDCGSRWAIDRTRDHYLLWAPCEAREDAYNQPFYAFVKGRMYLLRQESPFSPKFYLDLDSFSSSEERDDVLNEIREAFLCYGVVGRGTEGGEKPFHVEFLSMREFVPNDMWNLAVILQFFSIFGGFDDVFEFYICGSKRNPEWLVSWHGRAQECICGLGYDRAIFRGSNRKWDDVDFVPEPVEFQQQNRVRY